ncbi:VanZ family protein [Piscibacillus salipiscarius]|uniref:VanZ family protein n=1 Tax=Piscibacillus salipiscarius TaxID=299480 RepID=UPI0034E27475
MLIAVLSISIIEVSQLILGRGSMDIDDLILNTTGFIVGYLLTPLIQKNASHNTHVTKNVTCFF